MEYLYKNLTSPKNQSFSMHTGVLEITTYNTFKCDADFKIVLLENCVGKRFIGDHIGAFEGPELVLLGSYLQHCWQYYRVQDPERVPMSYAVHFSPDFLGRELLEKPETRELSDLFCDAARGIVFSGDTVRQAREILQQMQYEEGFDRMVRMIQLLHVLTRAKNYRVLSSPYFNMGETSTEGQKINEVFNYIYENFRSEISLQEVAAIVPLSTASFCRFFKRKTNKTLSDVIKEVRINHAAKLLLGGMCNVSESCYSSGYNNLSNFNKHFKEVKGLSPRSFLKQYQEESNTFQFKRTVEKHGNVVYV